MAELIMTLSLSGEPIVRFGNLTPARCEQVTAERCAVLGEPPAGRIEGEQYVPIITSRVTVRSVVVAAEAPGAGQSVG